MPVASLKASKQNRKISKVVLVSRWSLQNFTTLASVARQEKLPEIAETPISAYGLLQTWDNLRMLPAIR